VRAGDAVIAGEGEFEATAHAGAMDGGDGGDGEVGEAIEDALTEQEKLVELGGGGAVEDLDIGAGDEDVGFGALDDESAEDVMILFLDPLEAPAEFKEDMGGEEIRGRIRLIEGEDADAVGADGAADVGGAMEEGGGGPGFTAERGASG
jgi:hypothetical protein